MKPSESDVTEEIDEPPTVWRSMTWAPPERAFP